MNPITSPHLFKIQGHELSEILEQKKDKGETAPNGLVWNRLFGEGNPYDAITWEIRTAKITKSDGKVVFEQKNVEVPDFWSQTATDIVASKYFRGQLNSPQREYSARQMVDRVAVTIAGWGWKNGYFKTESDYLNFEQDLRFLLINQWAAFNSPVWFNVGVYERPQCSACQPYRALISAPRGFFKIGDVVENNLVGLPVYDSKGTTKIVAVKNSGIKTVYKVYLRNGAFIEATGDHLIRAVYERRTQPTWIRLDQLKNGMRLHLYPHRGIEQNKTLNNKLFYYKFESVGVNGHIFQQTIPALLSTSVADVSLGREISEAALAGWLQADGFVGQYKKGTNRSLTIEFLTINDYEKKWIEQHLEVVFPDIHKKTRITKTKLGTPITRIRLYGEKLRPFVNKYELQKRREQIRVPEILWKNRPEVIASYLKSVFQGEGYVSVRHNKKDEAGRLAIATISKDWIHDIQILLYGLGIYSRIIRKIEKRSNRQDLYELEIGYGSEKKKFNNLIGFISSDKQIKLISTLGLRNQKDIGDLREEEIISIEKLGEEQVYDIQTESGEYLTNNIAVHNCFILSVEDNMQSILEWYRDEGWIFKYGSGAGINLSKLRSSKEPLSRGGRSSGPVSFMKGADGVANSIRSGGTTRRAAKMVILNVDHPDIKEFIYSKKIIEEMTRILEASGIKASIEGDLFNPYTLLPYQNANNSVRVTDEFMRKVETDDDWELKAVTSGKTLEKLRARQIMDWIVDAAWYSADPGIQFDTTINDWHTCPASGRINASNPCSEYMFLDNTSCNLASLNLIKFLQADGSFNVESFKKAVDTMITAQEIIVGNSSYPTERITKNALDYRALGLGYANLGSLLMNMGLAYDSDDGRAIAAMITSIMCGEAYAMSAKIAGILGPFAGYAPNQEPMLRIIKKHSSAAENLADSFVSVNDGQMTGQEKLIDPVRNKPPLAAAAVPTAGRISNGVEEITKVWQKALVLGEKHGFRNSQVTVLAPTGTIAFLMDCDTTGVEPELALIKYKKLVGGGTLKLVNSQVPTALKRLGYDEQQISDISSYLLEKETIEGAPHLNPDYLPIFDCSFKAQNGTRSINYMGHIKMMGAVQPFISGAISKTVNLPNGATPDNIRDAFIQSWKSGLKSVAVYRDGCKSVQPLNTSETAKDTELKKKEEQGLVEKINGYTRIKLPNERPSITHKFSLANHEGYLTIGLYPDTMKPGETFITIAKEGSTISGLFDVIATLTSMCLQSGIPLKTLVRKFKDLRFEPAGFTSNPEIPFAKSFIDYIFKYLGHKFLSDKDKEEIFGSEHAQLKLTFGQGEDKKEQKLELPVTPATAVTAAANWEQDQDESHTDAPLCADCGTIMFKTGSCYSCPNCFATTGVCN